MLIKRNSILDGKEYSMEIDVTVEQLHAWMNGMLIQKAMPNLTPEEREFILSGILPDAWDKTFPKEDE